MRLLVGSGTELKCSDEILQEVLDFSLYVERSKSSRLFYIYT